MHSLDTERAVGLVRRGLKGALNAFAVAARDLLLQSLEALR